MTTILLVDDEFAVLQALARALAAEGYEVVTAGDGQEALEKLAARRCDLVLCDAVMPRLGGLELVRRLRASSELAGLPVILMAHPHEQVAGTDAIVLAKPVRLGPLLAALAQLR
jgi:CheY-like chemotaxis protein